MLSFIIYCLFMYSIPFTYGLERELTIYVYPGREDCFFQEVKPGQVIDLEYQVIDGGHGELDITFHVADSTGRILVADFKKSENNHRVEAKFEGAYKFCFDNTFSAFNPKVIFFEFVIEGDEDDLDWKDKNLDLQPEDVTDVKLEALTSLIHNMKTNCNKARHMQELIKSSEARDRNLAEENFFIVNTFSTFQIVIMIVVGLIQVIMVKSLFDDSSKVGKIWKKLNR